AAGRPLQGRDGAAGFRFTVYAALAVVIMYLDQRQHYLERLRYVLQAAAYPVQLAVNSPPAAWSSIRRSFEGRDQLQAENAGLKARQRDLELRSMRYEDLARENAELRGLRAALPPVADRWLPAEIVNVQLSSLRQRLLIDRGAVNGVFKGQAVLDDRGLIGQTTNVGPWSAEVILITDPEHGTPVRIERTGLRTIAVGAGDATSLALPYLPANGVKAGNAALQPQAAPPRPTAAPAPAMPKPAPEAARTAPRTGPAPRPKPAPEPATEPATEVEATSPAEGPPPAVDPAVPQPETQPPKGNR